MTRLTRIFSYADDVVLKLAKKKRASRLDSTKVFLIFFQQEFCFDNDFVVVVYVDYVKFVGESS